MTLTGEEPVEGYQPYSAFIQRRLGGAFEYIATLATKLGEFARDELVLNEAYSSLQMLNMTAEIRGAGDATRANTEAIQSEEDDIESIQSFGEGVLIVVLIPYYSAHVLEGMLQPIVEFVARDVNDVVSCFSFFFGVTFSLFI